MTGPKFDDGKGYAHRGRFGRRLGMLFFAVAFLCFIDIVHGVVEGVNSAEDIFKPWPIVAVFGPLGCLLMFSAKRLASNDETNIKHDPNRVVHTNHDNTDTDGRGQEYYANLKDWEIQQCEDTRVEMYDAEMREYEGR